MFACLLACVCFYVLPVGLDRCLSVCLFAGRWVNWLVLSCFDVRLFVCLCVCSLVHVSVGVFGWLSV